MTRAEFAAPVAIASRARRLSALFLAVVWLAGCSKGGPGNDISSSAFDSAPPDIKQVWAEAITLWKEHRYPDAATKFVSLQAKASALSKQQMDALAAAVDQFGQEAFTAANKGDAEATKAVQTLRGAGRRSANSP